MTEKQQAVEAANIVLEEARKRTLEAGAAYTAAIREERAALDAWFAAKQKRAH